jgi:hypothetical protein
MELHRRPEADDLQVERAQCFLILEPAEQSTFQTLSLLTNRADGG